MSENNLKCPYCHEEIKPNLKFCTHCGRSLVAEDSNSEVENSINSSSSEVKETWSLEKPELKSSSNKKKILWSIGGIACVLLLIISVSFFFPKEPNGDAEALNLIQNQVLSEQLVYGSSRTRYLEDRKNNNELINLYSSHYFSNDIKKDIEMYEKGCRMQNQSGGSLENYETKPNWIKGEQMKLEATLNLSAKNKISLDSIQLTVALFAYFESQVLYPIKSGEPAIIEEYSPILLKQVFNITNKTGYDIQKIKFIYKMEDEWEEKTIFDFKNDTEERIEFSLPSTIDPPNGNSISYTFYPSYIEIEEK